MPPVNLPNIDAADLEQLISAERFGPYRRATPSADEAVRLYEWNARASGAYAELLQHVEVLVRNAMHDALTAHHATIPGRPPGGAWFDSPSWVKHHWAGGSLPTPRRGSPPGFATFRRSLPSGP